MGELEYIPNEVDTYLQAGTQTQITPNIERIASTIEGTLLEKTWKIIKVVSSLESRDFDEGVFRKRTGSKIIEDKYITGCTDSALAFITLARASGIPTKYVETVDKKWLKKGGSDVGGHIYAQIYDASKDKWIWVDPMFRRINSPPKSDVVFKEGLDSWDIGIRDHNTLKTEFEKFRTHWLSERTSWRGIGKHIPRFS